MIISKLSKELIKPLEESLLELDNALIDLQTLCSITHQVVSQNIKDESIRIYIQTTMRQIQDLTSVLCIECNNQKAIQECVAKNIEKTMQSVLEMALQQLLDKLDIKGGN